MEDTDTWTQGQSKEETWYQVLYNSGGIYGISGISMDIPEISMFQDPATYFEF